jgi:cyclase
MFRTTRAVIIVLAVPALAPAQPLFELKPVVEGVYAAIARPQYKVNCNAAVIVLDDGVLIVDTHSKPSAARALIEQVRKLTDKPIRLVVNSHFHWDHYQGNHAYTSAWPGGVEIISSQQTYDNIERIGVPRVKNEIVSVPKQIEQLKKDLAAAPAADQPTLRDNLRQLEEYLTELKTMEVTLPTVTFDRSLILHRKGRTVQILWMGRAHTDGDVVVYLPKERFVATGDMLHGWIPYMGDSYPYEWISTLEAVSRLDFDYVLGGHGDVMRGKGQFEFWTAYFRDLMDRTASAYASGASIEQARTQVAAWLTSKYQKRFANFTAASIEGNVDKAYRVISGQTR